ncbi:MAG: hypothetical protein KF780_13910 [Sphingomonas sp.]|nr:hypothetical protein [Sphingomonas sp.]
MLSLQGDKDDRRKNKPGPDAVKATPPVRKKRRGSADIGTALRSAYQRTIDEDIPPSMLDLLGRLD